MLKTSVNMLSLLSRSLRTSPRVLSRFSSICRRLNHAARYVDTLISTFSYSSPGRRSKEGLMVIMRRTTMQKMRKKRYVSALLK